MSYSMKEDMIRKYISNIDLNEKSLSVNKIKEDLRSLIGEKPGVSVSYKKDLMINEVEGTTKEFVNADKLSIIFTDLDDKFKRIEFNLDDKA